MEWLVENLLTKDYISSLAAAEQGERKEAAKSRSGGASDQHDAKCSTPEEVALAVLTFAMVMPILLAWYNVLSCDGRDHYSSPGCTDTNATLLIAYAIVLGLLLNLLSGIAEAWVIAESEGRSKCVALLIVLGEWLYGTMLLTIVIIYVYSSNERRG